MNLRGSFRLWFRAQRSAFPRPAVRSPAGPAYLDEQLERQSPGQDGAREDARQGGEDLQQQGPQPVNRPCAFVGQIGVETGEYFQRGQHFGVPVHGPQGCGASTGPCPR